MEIRGEYWIINGQVDFADSDIGDIGHEGIATDYIVREFADKVDLLAKELKIQANIEKYGEPDIGEVERVLNEIYKYYLNQNMSSRQIYNAIEQNTGINQDALQVLMGRGDAARYVMKYEGWIAVRSNNAELYGYDINKQRELANGIGEIIWEESGEEDFDPNEVEITIYDHKTNKSWYTTLEELENPQVSAKTQQKIQTIYNKPIIPSPKPRNISYPSKWTQAARSAGIIGPGQDLWRGTSESLKMNFRTFLEVKKNEHFSM